ncbi:MAG: hypothetical protein IPI49_03095 [Myxococcales bacterium]|nr:hypothetical protein [Myxococcales bacterium]
MILHEVASARASGRSGAVEEVLQRHRVHRSHLKLWEKARAAGERDSLTDPASLVDLSRRSGLRAELDAEKQHLAALRQQLALVRRLIEVQQRGFESARRGPRGDLARQLEDAALAVLVPLVGVAAACAAIGVARATYYRDRPRPAAAPIGPPIGPLSGPR